MSVIGGILLFASGIAVGGGAVMYNRWSVENQTAQLRRENEHLKTSAWEDRIEFARDKAYRKGFSEGRKSPMSDVERFADTLDSGGYSFRMERRGTGKGGSGT